MTEAEWLACDDPVAMLKFLKGRAGERKLRLLACACARLQWDRLQDGVMREAVAVGERFADGASGWPEAQPYLSFLIRLPVEAGKQTGRNWFSEMPPEAVAAYFAAVASVGHFAGLSKIPDGMFWAEQSKVTRQRQPAILHELFGNPFTSVAVDPAWLTSMVVGHAGAAYEERTLSSGHLDPARLAVLSDALEEAGCSERAILDHLRSPGPHVRGCWPIDLVLGKQ